MFQSKQFELIKIKKIDRMDVNKNNLSEQNPKVKKDLALHFVQRTLALIIGLIVPLFILLADSLKAIYALVYIEPIIFSIWVAYLLIEAIILYSNKKYALGNVNLILIGSATLFLYFIVLPLL